MNYCVYNSVRRGVFSSRAFNEGEFALEYRGVLSTTEPELERDHYVFEIEHCRKLYWFALELKYYAACASSGFIESCSLVPDCIKEQ